MYHAIYKCRLCGEKILECEKGKSVETMTIPSVIDKKISNIILPINTFKYTLHSCKDGSLGFMNFLGFKKTED